MAVEKSGDEIGVRGFSTEQAQTSKKDFTHLFDFVKASRYQRSSSLWRGRDLNIQAQNPTWQERSRESDSTISE